MQDVSGLAVPLTGQCDVLLGARDKCIRVTARFTRELPVDALIGLDALTPLGLLVDPAETCGAKAGMKSAAG